MEPSCSKTGFTVPTALGSYLNSIGKFERLTLAEERELSLKIKNGLS